MPSYRQLARNHDFTALWIGATVAELGTRVSLFAMPLVAYAMTGSAFWAASAPPRSRTGTTTAPSASKRSWPPPTQAGPTRRGQG
jgi:hypothetical protein